MPDGPRTGRLDLPDSRATGTRSSIRWVTCATPASNSAHRGPVNLRATPAAVVEDKPGTGSPVSSPLPEVSPPEAPQSSGGGRFLRRIALNHHLFWMLTSPHEAKLIDVAQALAA